MYKLSKVKQNLSPSFSETNIGSVWRIKGFNYYTLALPRELTRQTVEFMRLSVSFYLKQNFAPISILTLWDMGLRCYSHILGEGINSSPLLFIISYSSITALHWELHVKKLQEKSYQRINEERCKKRKLGEPQNIFMKSLCHLLKILYIIRNNTRRRPGREYFLYHTYQSHGVCPQPLHDCNHEKLHSGPWGPSQMAAADWTRGGHLQRGRQSVDGAEAHYLVKHGKPCANRDSSN